MSLGKVMVLVIGLVMVTAPAAAWTTSYSWSGPGYQNPFGMRGGSYSPYGMMGSSQGYGSPFGYGSLPGGYGSPSGYSPFGYGSMFGNSPFSSFGSSPSYYNGPTTTANSLNNGDLLSDFGGSGGSIFNNKKDYGTPPTENITKALVGHNLSYDGGYMGMPLQYTLDKSDIGDVTGTQYKGADAWKVRVGQAGIYWDVIMDEAGNNILAVNQVK